MIRVATVNCDKTEFCALRKDEQNRINECTGICMKSRKTGDCLPSKKTKVSTLLLKNI